MQTRLAIALLGLMGLMAPAAAQRLTASGVQTDSGFVWQNGTGPTQWLRLRVTDVSVPPRTARYARATHINVSEGGDPFGRVVLFWSGWRSVNDAPTIYALKCLRNSAPLYEAAHLYDTFHCGNETLFGQLWNEQAFSAQTRSLEASVFVANAPLPFFAGFQQPSWTNLGSLDRMPNRPGVQVDPLLDAGAQVNYFSGAATVRRPLIENMLRAVGKNFYVGETRPSPFRDRVTMSAVATLKVNNDAPQTLWSRTYTAEWAPLDGTIDRGLGNEGFSHALNFRNYPVGTVLTLAYQVNADRLPFNKFDQPLNAPTREPIDDLRDGQNIDFDLKGLTYSYRGALSGGGSVSDGEASPVCAPKSAGSLNITLNLREFIPSLPTNLIVTLVGTRIDADTVRWNFDISPNQCVNLGTANALVKRVWGQLTATVQVVPVFLDDECGQFYNLRLVPEGGDGGNWINAELYALCFENAATRVNVAVRNIDYVAYGGGVFQQNDPRVLYRGLESQVIELIRYGDVNGDACVDDADLLEVLFTFGATGNNRADLNDDRVVDDADLLIVLFAFGNGC